MKLDKIFKSIADKMRIDFDNLTAEINHNASKGEVRENEVIESFLKAYLPNNIGVANGEIIDTTGQTSNECDVILYEKSNSPILLNKNSFQVFPIECVHGILEVKSTLNKAAIEDAFNKIHKMKKMPKLAFEPANSIVVDTTMLYDREWTYFPSLGFVFAYDSIDLTTLRQHIDNLQQGLPLHERIDSIWVLKKGMIVNWEDTSGMVCHTPKSSTRLRAVSSNNPLMLMTVQLQQLLQEAWMPKFKIQDYLQNASFGEFLEK